MRTVAFILFFSISALLTSSSQAQEKDWWETAVFYQIYPRSFRDSDGDGVGDINGVIEKMEHLKEIGVQATWLSPIMRSPQADFGYDISDFIEIDPLFGTMEDFENMVAKATELNIKIIMDFVPNHSSDQHEWFKKSVAREEGFEDFYIWNDGKDCLPEAEWDPEEKVVPCKPPNNWQSVFYGSAWTWNWERGQFYLHQFDKAQPDLNYRNPVVVQEMKDVLTFWLDKGASGFRVDAINHLFEVEDLRDEPLTGWTDDPLSYGYTHHWYTKDLDEMYDMIRQWRELLDDYTREKGTETKILMTEAYSNLTFTMKYYTTSNAHFPFNFGIIENLWDNSNARRFKEVIDSWMWSLPEGKTANWVVGNHDKPRVASVYGVERHDGMMAIELTLPGVAVTYNGEEIGMVDHRFISWEETVDPQACNQPKEEGWEWRSRDPQRTPFQWDDSEYAGFADELQEGKKLWLPLHPNYKKNNLKLQKEMERSSFSFYKDLTTLRQLPVMQHGSLKTLNYEDWIYTHVRSFEDENIFVVVNFSYQYKTIDLTRLLSNVARTLELIAVNHRSMSKVGERFEARSLRVRAWDALILKEVK